MPRRRTRPSLRFPFLYKEVLRRPLAYVDGIVHAKRPTRLPVVLSRGEVQRLFAELTPRCCRALLKAPCVSIYVSDAPSTSVSWPSAEGRLSYPLRFPASTQAARKSFAGSGRFLRHARIPKKRAARCGATTFTRLRSSAR